MNLFVNFSEELVVLGEVLSLYVPVVALSNKGEGNNVSKSFLQHRNNAGLNFLIESVCCDGFLRVSNFLNWAQGLELSTCLLGRCNKSLLLFLLKLRESFVQLLYWVATHLGENRGTSRDEGSYLTRSNHCPSNRESGNIYLADCNQLEVSTNRTPVTRRSGCAEGTNLLGGDTWAERTSYPDTVGVFASVNIDCCACGVVVVLDSLRSASTDVCVSTSEGNLTNRNISTLFCAEKACVEV